VLLRDSGIGPFATAGVNYFMEGIRSLGASPGLEATSAKSAAILRARTLARMAAVAGTVVAANYLFWGDPFGDEKTPFGNLKVGETADRKSVSIGLSNLFLVPRGLRSLGLMEAIEGERGGRKGTVTADRAVEKIVHSIVHPAMGPAAQFVHTALTGRNAIGTNIAQKAKDGEDVQHVLNLEAAAKNVNPALATALSYDQPPGKEAPWYERLSRILGPYGPQFREQPVGKAGQKKPTGKTAFPVRRRPF